MSCVSVAGRPPVISVSAGTVVAVESSDSISMTAVRSGTTASGATASGATVPEAVADSTGVDAWLAPVGRANAINAEHAVECAIELCLAIGYTLEAMPVGQAALGQVCGRLLELKGQKRDNGKSAYCRRVQFQILDLLETRAAGWSKKSFKTSAKTKDEIRQEQQREGAHASCAERVIAGQRPGYLP
ncbi:unnamed protein product [Prorocentrum cordatum]|uniref:Uncharacterized protein n=1 Tax=Prorocentrum cordatum TaxID=2364126 RepID=A0ABN9QKC5_9DINO|nr:unnamed protein product [Polarella glacialis]